MKKLTFIVYHLLKWLILLILFMSFSIFFILESPSPFFKLVEAPLKKQGIGYGKIEGSLLSGFVLHDVNYKNQVKVKSMALKVDLHQLENRVLYIDNLVLNEAEIDQEFLTSLIENNSTSETKSEENTTLPFDRVIVKNLDLSILNTSYDVYHVNHARLIVDGLETDMKTEHKGRVKFILDSNVSEMNLEASLRNENFKLAGNIKGEQLFIQPFLTEHNVTLLSNPSLAVKADGNLESIDFRVFTKALDVRYQHYKMHTKVLESTGTYDLKNNALKMNLKNSIESNIAIFEAKSDFKIKLDDVNNSLKLNLEAKFEPKAALLEEKLLIEQLVAHNIEINKLPLVSLLLKGDMRKLHFETNINDFKASQEKLSLFVKTLNIKGNTSPLNGATSLSTALDFDSTVAKGNLMAKAKLDFKKPVETLDFEVQSSLSAYEDYLNPLLQESNISLENETLVNLKSSGTLEKLKVKLDALATISKDNISSKVKLNTKDIFLDLKKESVDGSLSLSSNAQNLALSVQSEFSGNYMKPENLMSNSMVDISKFDAFSVNLTELLPLKLNINTDKGGAKVNMNANKLQLTADTRDYDQVDFMLKSEKIYPANIVELPKELKNKFIEVDLNGKAEISKEYFSLKGMLASNKKFKVNINAYSQANGLDVNIFTQHFKLKAKGDLKNKDIQAIVNIDSLKKVQKEFQLLYPFTSVDIDGALQVNANLKGEKASGKLTSSKLVFKSFNVEKVAIIADYNNDLLSIDKLNFETTGFKEKGLNRKFYLNQKAFAKLGEEKEIFLDMHPKISLKGEGNGKNLKAALQIEDLFLGYPGYGNTRLSCDIDYIQRGEKKRVLGAVFLDKMKVFYESKFLDPSLDNDVIVIGKKDKNKKETSDSFLEDTAIDLHIYASEANYKTRDIDLTLKVNLKAQKEFGKALAMLGKIEEIQGRVEQAPKLFQVVDSSIVFQGREEINPLLDLTVEHELPEILITINIHGNAKRPKLTFTSEPPLPKKDILSYLLLGVSTGNLGKGEGSLGREAQLFIMNQAARDLAYEVELDRVFVKDDGTGEGYAVQLGKKVQEDTMFVIENSKEGNSFILEYDVGKNINVQIGQHQKTVPSQSIDIYFRKKFK
ncbi:MAG: Unknown protein [uncultured Sulfurovum sp.]|uniref:Translocation and assembly module TamB C-terminal domain-containing protein n=1 Tax=uncultured Sulfurovum sp. TaxID=269237 RepID=A0A6S6S2Y8_9BACT|nr:MAG: Unknown protein [uncultured Sulfurovum sp.]